MNSFRKPRHSMEFLFPLGLLAIFALCGLIVLLQAADIYRSNVEKTDLFHQRYTPLAYISERVRSQDTSFSVVELPEGRALSFTREVGDEQYRTLIYVRHDRLCELLVNENAIIAGEDNRLTLSLSLDAGTAITGCSRLDIEPLEDGLWSLTSEDSRGNTASLILSEGGVLP